MERTSGSSNVSGYVTIDLYSEPLLTMLVVLIISCVSTSVSVPHFVDGCACYEWGACLFDHRVHCACTRVR